MDLALDLARSARDQNEVPVGAVITRNGRIIAKTANCMRTMNDPTAHAEILALRQACEILQTQRLTDCDLYVTLEPCAMCAAAISYARIRRLYYGVDDPKGGAVINGVRFFNDPTCHHKPEVIDGIRAKQSRDLLEAFFASRR